MGIWVIHIEGCQIWVQVGHAFWRLLLVWYECWYMNDPYTSTHTNIRVTAKKRDPQICHLCMYDPYTNTHTIIRVTTKKRDPQICHLCMYDPYTSTHTHQQTPTHTHTR